jgi:hypothetical protein
MNGATLWKEGPVAGGGRITPTGCRVAPLRLGSGGVSGPIAVDGPPSADGFRAKALAALYVDRSKRAVSLRTDAAETSAKVGEWTAWTPISFRVAPFMKVHGLSRWRLLETAPLVSLYQEPTCFDPLRQSRFAPVTSPKRFGAEVLGGRRFDTLGWACATNPLQDELIDEETFLSDVEELDRDREEMVLRAAADKSKRLVFCVLATPDRVQHLFWRDYDPKHPRHDPDAIKRRGDPIRESYARIDALIGKIRRDHMERGDLLLVVSDHGFASFRVAVNLNRFLAEEGLLSGVGRSEERSIENDLDGDDLFPGVDWAATKAYSIGLGKIWINVEGREPRGSVPPTERRKTMEDLKRRLLALRYEGAPVVRSVKFREDLYEGEMTSKSADVIVGFEDGFRVSWQSTLGSLSEPVFAPNRNLWSGDHCSVDPDLVQGVFFASRKVAADFAHAVDVFPTVESALGLPRSPRLDGTPLPWKTE